MERRVHGAFISGYLSRARGLSSIYPSFPSYPSSKMSSAGKKWVFCFGGMKGRKERVRKKEFVVLAVVPVVPVDGTGATERGYMRKAKRDADAGSVYRHAHHSGQCESEAQTPMGKRWRRHLRPGLSSEEKNSRASVVPRPTRTSSRKCSPRSGWSRTTMDSMWCKEKQKIRCFWLRKNQRTFLIRKDFL